jgi:Protein of unknown function (DUF3800)
MATFKGYFDESGKEDDPQFADSACAVAGYVAPSESWKIVEADWAKILERFHVPYLHMNEFAHSLKGSPFETWKNQESRRAEFLHELAGVIANSELSGVAALIRLPDLRRFNSEKGVVLEAYPLGIFACLIELAINFPDTKMETVWDRVDRHEKRIAAARSYAEGEAYYSECGKGIDILALSQNLNSRKVPALQIADFAAYELLKSHRDKNDWFLNEMPKTDPENWASSQAKWSFDRMIDAAKAKKKSIRTGWPDERKSYLALFHAENARPMEGGVWNYQTLCDAHAARNGVWPASCLEP